MADRIINQLITLDIINREDADVYQFGLEILSLKVFHYISYLLIAISFHEIICFLIFFMAFILLRKSAGGYHAKTKGRCYFSSCITVLVMIMCIKGFSGLTLWQISLGCMLIVLAGDMIIWKIAPLGNRSRILDEEENKIFRHRTHLFLVFENLFVFMLMAMRQNAYALPIVLAVGCEAALLLLEKLRKGSNEIEQEINNSNH